MSSESIALAEKVQDTVPEAAPDTSELADALDVLDAGLARRAWPMNQTQRLALGTHLAAAARRFDSGERLDPIDPVIFAEVSAEAQELAREVLEPIRRGADVQPEEVFLAAVHVDAARQSNENEEES